MCGPFSSINDFNYAKRSEYEIRDKLQNAMLHMRFALTMCLQQFPAGRLFMFEHPAGASLWETKMHAMLGRAGRRGGTKARRREAALAAAAQQQQGIPAAPAVGGAEPVAMQHAVAKVIGLKKSR